MATVVNTLLLVILSCIFKLSSELATDGAIDLAIGTAIDTPTAHTKQHHHKCFFKIQGNLKKEGVFWSHFQAC